MVHESVEFSGEFRKTKDGKITPTLYNTLHVLEGDREWRGVLAFNQFSYRITKRRAVPGHPKSEGEWADIDDVRLQVYLTRTHGFEAKKGTVMDAVMQVAYANPYHPVREYLSGLKWDGKPRLATMLADMWGVLSTPDSASLRKEDPGAYLRLCKYLELAGTKWLVGAVARIMKPGCKLDTMMVFEGGQGDFKSTAIRALFGDEWFSDSKLKIGDKDALAQMQGKWAYEMAEMDAHRKADDTEFKMFLTTQVDRVRWHYGKRAEDVPRQCIFVGTTNMGQYGKDETGMRRIWPAHVGKVDLERITSERDQLWAEALALFQDGARWWVDKRAFVLEPDDYPVLERPWSEWDVFDEQGDSRQIVDAWETPIIEWLGRNNLLEHVTTAQVMGDALVLDKARWTPPEQKRVAAIMRRLGYKSKKCGPKSARVNGWVKDQNGGVDVPF
jgi:putative DNA primase/helicase